MARRRTRTVTEAAPFQRPYWNRAQRRRPVSFRILQLKLDIAHGVTEVKDEDVVGATFTATEVDILERVARGEPVIGITLPQHIAAYQLKWMRDGGYKQDDEDDSA